MSAAPSVVEGARVVRHDDLDSLSRAGLEQRVLADARDGLSKLRVFEEILHPNGRITPWSHPFESVILVLAGDGDLLTEQGSQPFVAPCTLVLPAGRMFGVGNRGSRPIAMLRVLASAGGTTATIGAPALERR